jgi:hypothetical protein
VEQRIGEVIEGALAAVAPVASLNLSLFVEGQSGRNT